jgi:hypothetical protein
VEQPDRTTIAAASSPMNNHRPISHISEHPLRSKSRRKIGLQVWRSRGPARPAKNLSRVFEKIGDVARGRAAGQRAAARTRQRVALTCRPEGGPRRQAQQRTAENLHRVIKKLNMARSKVERPNRDPFSNWHPCFRQDRSAGGRGSQLRQGAAIGARCGMVGGVGCGVWPYA